MAIWTDVQTYSLQGREELCTDYMAARHLWRASQEYLWIASDLGSTPRRGLGGWGRENTCFARTVCKPWTLKKISDCAFETIIYVLEKIYV